MAVYIIGYDLRKAGQNYSGLHEQIKSYGTWQHTLDSTWIIRTSKTSAQIRDHLINYIDANDSLVVFELTGNGAWYGIGQDGDKWLLDVLNNRG